MLDEFVKDPPIIAKQLLAFKEVDFPVDELKEIESSDLWRDEILERIRKNILDPYYRAELGEAVEYAAVLRQKLQAAGTPTNNQQHKAQIIQDYIDYLLWASLSEQSVETIERLFSSRVLLVFSWEVDLIERTLMLFKRAGIPQLGWERWHKVLQDAMRKNIESFGPSGLTINTAGGTVPLTIGALLRDYDAQTNVTHRRTSIERVTYFNKTKLVSFLSSEVQERLLTILSLYDLTVFLPVGIPVTQAIKARPAVLSAPAEVVPLSVSAPVAIAATAPVKITPAPPPVPPAGLGPVSVKESQEVEKFFQTISAAPSPVPSVVEGTSLGVKQEDPVKAMLRVLSNKKQIEVHAYLRYFALSGELPDLMLNPEIMKIFKPYLERKLGQAAALAYTSKPKRPTYVKLFLQWVFEDQLKMTTEDANPRIKPIVDILAVDDPEFLTGL